MQFKVPQNIDMQDRIIGPLTLSQFFYLLFGGLIIYILFNKLAINGYGFLFFLLAVPIGVFSAAMAFFRVQDRPFPTFFLALIQYLRQPRARVWRHYNQSVARPQSHRPNTQKTTTVTRKGFDAVRVSELADVLDSPTVREDHGS